MPVYKYEAMNRHGNIVRGSVFSDDEPIAVTRLQDAGLIVLDLQIIRERTASRRFRPGNQVKVADLALFSRQLAAMLGAGIPVTQALFTLSHQTVSPILKEALEDISAAVEAGANLTQAFSRHSTVFPPIYVAMLSAGESGGNLEASLIRLSTQLQTQKQLDDNIKSATSYPKMIGIFALLMFFAMLVFLVPIFEGFIPFGTPIPAITRATFSLSHHLRDFWYLWLVAAIALVYGLLRFARSKKGRELWENYKMRLPIFGVIIQKSVIARFSRTLATLLQGGVPVVQALESAGPTSGSELVSAAVSDVIVQIEEGKSIAQPLQKSGLFPPMVTNMIAIGEEAGTLPELLDKIAEFYEEDVSSLTKQLGSMIEPVMLILIGVLVGGMLLSLYLPIFTAVTAAA